MFPTTATSTTGTANTFTNQGNACPPSLAQLAEQTNQSRPPITKPPSPTSTTPPTMESLQVRCKLLSACANIDKAALATAKTELAQVKQAHAESSQREQALNLENTQLKQEIASLKGLNAELLGTKMLLTGENMRLTNENTFFTQENDIQRLGINQLAKQVRNLQIQIDKLCQPLPYNTHQKKIPPAPNTIYFLPQQGINRPPR